MHIPDAAAVIEHRLAIIDERLVKIDQEIAQRQASSQQSIALLQHRIDTCRTALGRPHQLSELAGDQDYRRAKAIVHQWIHQTQQQLAQEQINAWADIQTLRRERRELDRERHELAYTLDVLRGEPRH